MIRVMVVGEGNNELGSSVAEGGGAGTGVIEELIGKVRRGGYEIRVRKRWKDAPKLRVGVNGTAAAEARAVQAFALFAVEHGCNALIFLRDRDGEVTRERTIAEATQREQSKRPKLKIAGGVPIEMLESWLLALKGELRSEYERDPAGALEQRHGVVPKRTTDMVQLVLNTALLAVPADAQSLWRWLRKVATALGVKIPKQWPNP